MPEPLDNIRIVEPGEFSCRSRFSRLFNATNITTGEKADINCKSWRCAKHREKWGRKWGAIISEQLATTPVTLLVNLTTAEFTGHEIIEKAMRRFIKVWRAIYGATEYIRVTEMNQAHTQCHYHCLFVMPGLEIEPIPEKWPKKDSWPASIWHDICEIWGEALAMYAPLLNATTVAWCQPPKTGQGQGAAYYAIGYITGKNKNEEPDETYQGRKLTYSNGFFSQPAQEIYRQLLLRWFGPPEETRYFWQPKPGIDFAKLPPERSTYYFDEDHYEKVILGVSDQTFFDHIINLPIMRQRYQEALFYRDNGRWPTNPTPASPNICIEITPDGQTYFTG